MQPCVCVLAHVYSQVRLLLVAGVVSLILETIHDPKVGWINGLAILLAGSCMRASVLVLVVVVSLAKFPLMFESAPGDTQYD